MTLHANDILVIENRGEELLAKSDDVVPEVDAEDIEAVWKLVQKEKANKTGNDTLPSMRSILVASKLGANAWALWSRVVIFQLLISAQEQAETEGLLPEKIQANDAAFQALAKIPMRWHPNGDDSGFDIEEFVRLVHEAEHKN